MSIKANELRIGNWVKQLQTGRYDQVDLFMLGEIASDETYLDHLFGIPLTPEILEKAGFVKDGKNYDGFEYWYPNESALWSIRNVNNGAYQFVIWVRTDELLKFDNPITSLHQLQNLYFALTGEELIVKF